MGIEIVKFDDVERWDQVVSSFAEYDVYFLNEYVRAFFLHNDGVPELIYYYDNNNKAMNVVMKRSIQTNVDNEIGKDFFDYSTPYGYGGFVLEGCFSLDDKLLLWNEYQDICLKNNIVSEFVRFHPLLENAKSLNQFYDVTELGPTISMPLKSKEYVWNNLNKKNRNVIRKAQKNGVKIYWGRDFYLLQEFVRIYNQTMDKDNALDYYYFGEAFFYSILYDLKNNSMFFYAVFEGRIIAMSIVMFCNRKLHYHLSASDQKFIHLAPSNLLLYEAACWGAVNGYKSFHLGGGLGSKEDSLFKFKKSFVKEHLHTNFSIGKIIFNKRMYDQLCIQGNIEKNTLFFPAYRLKSNKIFR